MNDKKFREAVALQVAEMGWDGFLAITNDNEREARRLSNGGWSAIASYVEDIDIETLRDDWDYLEDEYNEYGDDDDEDDEPNLTLSKDEKLFMSKKDWYNKNEPIKQCIATIKTEIKTVKKNVRKRRKFIAVLENIEDKEIGIKDFFLLKEKPSKCIIDGEEVKLTKKEIENLKIFLAKAKKIKSK